MADLAAPIEIPKRALFKAAEVCDLLKVQSYVLRSWEAEFPEIGVAKASGGARVYRRSDVERVARIKHLLLVEGLTLAGARRRLDEEGAPVGADAPAIDELLGQNARERLTEVKRGLRSILDLLAGSNGGLENRAVVLAASGSRARPVQASRAKASRGKLAARGRRGASAGRKDRRDR
jgi:DNA-binding transcriptional MerR regulator